MLSRNAQLNGPVPNPYAAILRLERMLHRSMEVRERYQRLLYSRGQFTDLDFERCLTEDETAVLHNEWRNDVSEWMTRDTLQNYQDLVKKSSAGKPAERKKNNGSAPKKKHIRKRTT